MQLLSPNQQEFAVFIGGIPKACRREYIYNILKKAVYVKKLDMPKDHTGGKQNKGHAFLHVRSQEEVDKLLKMGSVKIRNTQCDIMPYKKNDRRIQEESGCPSDYGSGRSSVMRVDQESSEMQETSSENEINLDLQSPPEPVSRNSLIETTPVTTPAAPQIFIGDSTFVNEDYFLKLGIDENTAKAVAECINQAIIEKYITKEYFESNFPAMLNHYQTEIYNQKLNEMNELLRMANSNNLQYIQQC